MQTVAIDCRFAAHHGGLGTYTRSIVRALLRRNDPWSYVLFVASDGEKWVSEFALRERVSFCLAPFPHYSFAEQWHLPILLRETGADLFYSPHFNVPLLCTTPFFCTVHDLILHRFPNQAGIFKRLAYRFLLQHSIRAARGVLAVSESTKNDLAAYYPASREKTDVISNAVELSFSKFSQSRIDEVRKKFSLPATFLLYVGNCKEHKNVPMLLEAFELAALQDVELILVSGGKECALLSLPPKVRRISDLDEDDLPAMYSASAGCVSATLYEGFGLPMAEAMACGVPVMTTNVGAVPEVCGGNALLVESTLQSLSEGMKRIILDEFFISPERLAKAAADIRRFDWDISAAKLSLLFSRELSVLHHRKAI